MILNLVRIDNLYQLLRSLTTKVTKVQTQKEISMVKEFAKDGTVFSWHGGLSVKFCTFLTPFCCVPYWPLRFYQSSSARRKMLPLAPMLFVTITHVSCSSSCWPSCCDIVPLISIWVVKFPAQLKKWNFIYRV